MEDKIVETVCPSSVSEWRAWLKNNHQSKQSVWLIQYKKKSANPSLSWSEAVDEALCYGWIDSIRKSIDEQSFKQMFSKRKPSSAWSKINKQKIEQLISQGRMEDAGLKSIEIAKQNGSWNILDAVEELIIPKDLEKAFEDHPHSKAYFLNLSKSKKKIVLHSITIAKREETRERRIQEFVEMSKANL